MAETWAIARQHSLESAARAYAEGLQLTPKEIVTILQAAQQALVLIPEAKDLDYSVYTDEELRTLAALAKKGEQGVDGEE